MNFISIVFNQVFKCIKRQISLNVSVPSFYVLSRKEMFSLAFSFTLLIVIFSFFNDGVRMITNAELEN